MSAIPLTKMEIDILVQLALHGPIEASHWRALVENADELGIRLWTLNVEYTGDTDVPVSSYKFEPLPIGITAAEGIRQCQYYLYQTADEEVEKTWAVGEVLFSLLRQLPQYVPEVAAAPWGFSLNDLEARKDRESPVSDLDDFGLDEDFETLRAQWERLGVTLQQSQASKDMVQAVGDPRDIRAVAYYRPEVHSGFPAVLMVLASSVEAAEKIYAHQLAERHRTEWQWPADVHVYQFGETVVDSRFDLERQTRFSEEFHACLSGLGEPDRHWWCGGPPLQSVNGEVLATRVRLTPDRGGTHMGHRALVANSPRELDKMLDMVEDPELRERMQAIPLESKSVILLRGMTSIDQVKAIEVNERVLGYLELGHVVNMHTEGATMGIATVVVSDRLKETPRSLVIIDQQLPVRMIADTP